MTETDSSRWTPRKILMMAGAMAVVILAANWWNRTIGAPQQSHAMPVLEHLFARPVKVMDDAAQFLRLTRDAIAGIETFACRFVPDPNRSGLKNPSSRSANHDCILRLRGTDGRVYLTGALLVAGGHDVPGFSVYIMPVDRFIDNARALGIPLP